MICRFLIDPLFKSQEIDFIGYFESILNNLFQHIEDSKLKKTVTDFKKNLLKIAPSHFKIVTILKHIPRINIKARKFQIFIAFHTLSTITKKRVFYDKFLFFQIFEFFLEPNK